MIAKNDDIFRVRRRLRELNSERDQLFKKLSHFLSAASPGILSKRLIRAIEKRDADGVRHALRQGADPNARDDQAHPALLLAIYCRAPLTIVRMLLQAGADVNLQDTNGNTALIAGIACSSSIVNELLAHGADVNAHNDEGDTALTNAAIWGSEKAVKQLLKANADPTLPDGIGLTALDLARQHKYKRIVAILQRATRRAGAQTDKQQRVT